MILRDIDTDGDVDSDDGTLLGGNGGATLGWGPLSDYHNRLGYAGYVFEVVSVTEGTNALARGVQLVVAADYSRVLAERARGPGATPQARVLDGWSTALWLPDRRGR